MTDSFQAHKDVMQFLSQTRAMRSALVKRLYCAVCAVFMGVVSTRTLGINMLERISFLWNQLEEDTKSA